MDILKIFKLLCGNQMYLFQYKYHLPQLVASSAHFILISKL